MASSFEDIIVDADKGNYKFYYKPLPNNSGKKTTQKQQKYKCYLHVGVWSPRHIHINDFDCKGRGGGAGKFLFCKALNFLKTRPELNLDDDTVVTLTAMSLDKATPRESQDKLIAYYSQMYGFNFVKEKAMMNMYQTDMATTIKTVLEKCMVPRQNKTLRQKISNLLASLKRR